jgi:hypothetical protein
VVYVASKRDVGSNVAIERYGLCHVVNLTESELKKNAEFDTLRYLTRTGTARTRNDIKRHRLASDRLINYHSAPLTLFLLFLHTPPPLFTPPNT